VIAHSIKRLIIGLFHTFKGVANQINKFYLAIVTTTY